MERMIHEHEPSEGVLVWGGPQHARVVPFDRDTINHGVIEFTVERRISAKDDPMYVPPISFQKVAYSVRRWAVPWDERNGEMWFVLVYKENEERLIANLTATANFAMSACHWLGEGWGGR